MENDAISRSAVLALTNIITVKGIDFRCIFPEEVKHLPVLDVAPVVHAKWVGGKYYNDVYGYEKTCTACQKEYVVGFDYLYCPYCGAKMDGEENAADRC